MLGIDLADLIRAVGYLGLFAIIFAESGLLIGFFLPGDSLLFTAGFLASQGFLDLGLLCGICFVAAVAGDQVGYAFGRRVGRPLFDRPDSRFFKRKHLLAAEAFYEKHGPKTIVIARFLPIVRTFAPIVAGVATMHYRRFVVYNVVGGGLWAIGVPVAGYWLGSTIPQAGKYMEYIIVAIVVVSVLPSALHVWKEHRAEITAALRGRLGRGPAGPVGEPSAVNRVEPAASPLGRDD